MRTIARLLACVSLVLSLPLAVLAITWLPVLWKEFAGFFPEPYPTGSESYLSDRHGRMIQLICVFILDVLGAASLPGLLYIAVGKPSSKVQSGIWIASAILGLAVALYWWPSIDFSATDGHGIFIFLGAPLGVAALSALGFLSARKVR